MPAELRDMCIAIYNRKKLKPQFIYRTLIRGLIDDEEIFMKSAKQVKEKYPIVDACKGM